MADYDPRVVHLYDVTNPDGPDHDFFRALADQVQAATVVDLGCGTGILTVTLAREGRMVIRIDPSTAMLDFARRRPGADRVSWVLGDCGAIGSAEADLVVMSGNVAQHITGPAWPTTLADIHGGLRPGGHLVFERRNPAARAWEDWTPEKTRTTRRTPFGLVEEWMEVMSVQGEDVTFASHMVLTATGEDVVECLRLAFRSQDDVRADLDAAGFEVVGAWSSWDRQPLQPNGPLMIFHALRR